MDEHDRPWSVPVAVAEIPDGGSHYDLVADAAVREAVMKLARLEALPRLEASFDLSRRGDSVAVRGEVRAQVGQTCVVTLQPMESAVQEPVDLVFEPPEGDALATEQKKRRGEPPELLENGQVDLGAIATEFLILGLDPYPRKEGAAFAQAEGDKKGASPFEALAALKKRP